MNSESTFVRKVCQGPDKPMLVYDGECPFCVQWVNRWRKRLEPRIELADLRIAVEQFPEIGILQFKKSVHFIDENGGVFRGAEAVFRAFARTSSWAGTTLLWLYRRLPGFDFFCQVVYKTVARHRNFLFHVTRWLG